MIGSYREVGDSMIPGNKATQGGDFITIFKTGSVDPEENPELADQLLESPRLRPRRRTMDGSF